MGPGGAGCSWPLRWGRPEVRAVSQNVGTMSGRQQQRMACLGASRPDREGVGREVGGTPRKKQQVVAFQREGCPLGRNHAGRGGAEEDCGGVGVFAVSGLASSLPSPISPVRSCSLPPRVPHPSAGPSPGVSLPSPPPSGTQTPASLPMGTSPFILSLPFSLSPKLVLI